MRDRVSSARPRNHATSAREDRFPAKNTAWPMMEGDRKARRSVAGAATATSAGHHALCYATVGNGNSSAAAGCMRPKRKTHNGVLEARRSSETSPKLHHSAYHLPRTQTSAPVKRYFLINQQQINPFLVDRMPTPISRRHGVGKCEFKCRNGYLFRVNIKL